LIDMEIENAKILLKSVNTDFKLKNRIFRGLQILSKYDENMTFCAEHDQLYVCNFADTVTEMTEDEVVEMGRLGWIESEDSWSHFT